MLGPNQYGTTKSIADLIGNAAMKKKNKKSKEAVALKAKKSEGE